MTFYVENFKDYHTFLEQIIKRTSLIDHTKISDVSVY
jgi:hypothetical protein